MEHKKENLKISIIGGGYVGMSQAALLSKKYHVSILDINRVVVDKINNHVCPFDDQDLENYLKNENLSISATDLAEDALGDAEIVIIATPTDFDFSANEFDTSVVESSILNAIRYSPDSLIVIKSTVPVGFTSRIQNQYPQSNIIFCPEFLREGQALHDNLYPSRIIIGGSEARGKIFASILEDCSNIKNVPILFMDSQSAEAVKLFSNTYLAMRVGFFNELDSFAQSMNLDSKDIIKGVSLDQRIGNFYNNPSFGYGGYCLPKDTQQLLSNFKNIPQALIQATVSANQSRKLFIASEIISLKPKVVGVYKLSMKTGSDNYRSSAIIDIISELKRKKIKVIIFDPSIREDNFKKCSIIKDLNAFIEKSCIVIANRSDKYIEVAADKLFTRDIFGNN
ncbi:nucleotide sugar dehydrogenase [Gammaproteobacteria bacterium]|nr:nucleotide sugar dehydrogenase [Gammaproteobacteria bacterium]